METAVAAASVPLVDIPLKRTSLNGCWILDRTRGNPSIQGYLTTMKVNEDAVEAHEKGEIEQLTFHTITLDNNKVKIVKRSRVNSDLTVELDLGVEQLTLLDPGAREKKLLALSENPRHLYIQSSLNTVNGMAKVVDVKNLVQEQDGSVMVQELTITNEQTQESNTTTRYFVPYEKTPPHLVNQAAAALQGIPTAPVL